MLAGKGMKAIHKKKKKGMNMKHSPILGGEGRGGGFDKTRGGNFMLSYNNKC